MKKVILASSSPRRQELFKKLGVEFTIQPSDFNEETIEIGDPEKLAKALALAKARTVAERSPGSLVVGADTIVVRENEIFGKPRDEKHAKYMLAKLSGTTHRVITGFAVVDSDTHHFALGCDQTLISFKPLADSEIDAYVKSREPFDKAGGYAIQGLAKLFIDKIQGDYFNVVGLPLRLLAEHLKNAGVPCNPEIS